jgi:ABC-type Fe3+-hydroxamate transport system substrate-binding protein
VSARKVAASHILLALLAIAPTVWLSACVHTNEPRVRSNQYATSALGRVYTGMPLDVAVQELRASEGFWRHGFCGYSVDRQSGRAFTTQLFYYGSQNPSETDAVFLRASGVPGHEVVERVARLDPDLVAPWLLTCQEIK